MASPFLGLGWIPVAVAAVVVPVGFFIARRAGERAFDRRRRLAEVLTVGGALSILLGLIDAASKVAEGAGIGAAPGWAVFAGCIWLTLGLPLFRRRRN